MAKQKTDALAPVATPTLAEFNPRDPQTILATAQQLAQFISTNKLASTIQGRSYVQAEGWQFLFAVAGIDVVCARPYRLTGDNRPDTEICYEAEARLYDKEGREVGYGYALCSDAERTKKGWAEYAIASMAQTRAIGKAGRNRFAFVMKAAGFEPTPAEEMSEVGTGAEVLHSRPAGGNGASSAPSNGLSEKPAASSSDAPAASAGAESREPDYTVIIAQTRELLAGATSTVALNEGFNHLPPFLQQQLRGEFTAAKERIKAAVAQVASTPVVRQMGPPAPEAGNVKDAGADTALVDALIPAEGETSKLQPATAEQKEHIIRLLNCPQITRREKTKMLLNINRLDTMQARTALVKLRAAIDERQGDQPTEADQRASLEHLLRTEGHLLTEQQATDLRSLLADEGATLDTLTEALEGARGAVLDSMSYGTDAELAEVEAAAA